MNKKLSRKRLIFLYSHYAAQAKIVVQTVLFHQIRGNPINRSVMPRARPRYFLCAVIKKLRGILWLMIIFYSAAADPMPQQLSFDFEKISVRALINLLAKYRHENIIISNQVANQEMSIHLENVSWQEALTTILSSQSLSMRRVGDTLLIAPINEMNQQMQQQFSLEEQQKQLAPLNGQMIHLRYAKAQELATLFKENNNHLLSARGTIAVDARTNSLWIEDTPTQLSKLNTLITQLDQPTKQISIEARIVTIDSNYEQELGIRFGVTGGDHLSGTLTGANQIHSQGNAASVPLKDRLNFDFPALPTAGNPASIGLALAQLGDDYLLDLELSALQAEGAAEIIAKPSLATANQQTATIQTGEEIPYQEKTYSGDTNVAFKKAVLSLEVTPQITADNHILLTLHISQDKPSNKLVNGVPAIDTRDIQTQVLVNNRQTLVLGGIYESTQNHQMERVPFISDLPFIGALFQHKHEALEKRELLIFVRPTIL